MIGCKSPDCEFMGRPKSGFCFAHEQGKNPVMTLEQYQNQTGPIYRNIIGEVVPGDAWEAR